MIGNKDLLGLSEDDDDDDSDASSDDTEANPSAPQKKSEVIIKRQSMLVHSAKTIDSALSL